MPWLFSICDCHLSVRMERPVNEHRVPSNRETLCVIVLAKLTHPTVHGFHRTRSRHPHLVVKRFKATQRRMFYTFPRLPEATRFVQLLLLEMGRSTRGRLADSFLLFSHSRRASLEKEGHLSSEGSGQLLRITLHT